MNGTSPRQISAHIQMSLSNKKDIKNLVILQFWLRPSIPKQTKLVNPDDWSPRSFVDSTQVCGRSEEGEGQVGGKMGGGSWMVVVVRGVWGYGGKGGKGVVGGGGGKGSKLSGPASSNSVERRLKKEKTDTLESGQPYLPITIHYTPLFLSFQGLDRNSFSQPLCPCLPYTPLQPLLYPPPHPHPLSRSVLSPVVP